MPVRHPLAERDAAPAAVTVGTTTYAVRDGVIDCPPDREDAVADLAANTDQTVLHYWDGPDDESTTDICEWLKGETNPEYGGDPVPMDELRDLQREAITRFTDRDPGAVDIRAHLLHPNERHTHKSILESEVA